MNITTRARDFVKRFLVGPPSANTIDLLDRFIITGWLSTLSKAGVEVNTQTAQTLTAVYRAVELLSTVVGMLPLEVYRVTDGGKERATDHHLYDLLHSQVNEEHTSVEYREMVMGHMVLRNNAYSIIERTAGRVTRLVPLIPDSVEVRRLGGELFYKVHFADGVRTYPRDEIHHVRGRMENNVLGHDRLRVGTDAIGTGLAAQQSSAKFIANNSTPGGILQTPQNLTPDAKKKLREQWQALQGGSQNSGKVAVLENGLEWTAVGVDPQKAQMIETREYNVEDVSRWSGVPVHMLSQLKRATFNNIEHMGREFTTFTLMPWLTRWEQAMERDLVPAEERGKIIVRFNVKALVKADLKTRYASYATARNWGWMSVNDIRALEDMNSIGSDGDMYLVPMNMIPVEQVTEPTLPAPREPEGETEIEEEEEEERSLMREARSAALIRLRLRARSSHKRLYRDAFGRIVSRETQMLEQKLANAKTRGDVRHAIESVYDPSATRQNLNTMVMTALTPALASFAEVLDDAVDQELGRSAAYHTLRADNIEHDDDDTEQRETRQADALADDQALLVARRYLAASERQLLKLAEEAESDEEALALVLERTAAWKDTKADKETERTIVDSESVFLRAAYVAAGVARLMWQTTGDSCPLCDSLNGKIVGVESNFVSAGETIDPGDGKTTPLTPRRDVGGPQAHQGCACTIISA